MNAQSDFKNRESRTCSEFATAWTIGLVSLALWAVFTPYVALEQARQLALCLAMLCGTAVLATGERVRKVVASSREAHWHGFHGSAA